MQSENFATRKSIGLKAGEMVSSCVATRVRLINRAISSLFDDALREHGIKISQVNLLVIIYKLGDAKSSDVCNIMKMDSSTLSRNMERMKKKGWLDTKSQDGVRAHTLSLTEAGEELLEKVYPSWKAAQRQAVQILDVEGVDAIFKISSRVWAK